MFDMRDTYDCLSYIIIYAKLVYIIILSLCVYMYNVYIYIYIYIYMYPTQLRPVQYGEELTMDYNSITTSDVEWRASVCLCGTSSCRGTFLTFATQADLQQVCMVDMCMLVYYMIYMWLLYCMCAYAYVYGRC